MDRAMNLVRQAALLGAACALAASAQAQTQTQALSDPTRPPVLASPEAKSSAGSAGSMAEPSRPILQSVLIGRQPGGRRVAVIDGQTLRLGEKFKGAVLVGVSDNQVLLRRGAERQVLRLYPASDAAPDAFAPPPAASLTAPSTSPSPSPR